MLKRICTLPYYDSTERLNGTDNNSVCRYRRRYELGRRRSRRRDSILEKVTPSKYLKSEIEIMAFHFSRDTKVFMKFHGTGTNANTTDDALYEIPVLDGFSFSQATNTSEVTLSEASSGSDLDTKRGRAMFNDSYAPAEWSFSTYMRPTTSDSSDTYTIASGAGLR